MIQIADRCEALVFGSLTIMSVHVAMDPVIGRVPARLIIALDRVAGFYVIAKQLVLGCGVLLAAVGNARRVAQSCLGALSHMVDRLLVRLRWLCVHYAAVVLGAVMVTGEWAVLLVGRARRGASLLLDGRAAHGGGASGLGTHPGARSLLLVFLHLGHKPVVGLKSHSSANIRLVLR